MNKIALIGYSGHALVAADILLQAGYVIEGYLEKTEVSSNLLNIPYLGFELNKADRDKIKGILVFPAIGDNTIRAQVMIFMRKEGFIIPSAVSTKANISKNVNIDFGSLIGNGACLNPFVKIGQGVIINTGAIIEHECQIENYVHIAPGAVLAGNVEVGAGSFIGANSVVKQGVSVGANVIIGAGAVVLKDVPDNSVLVGNPAKLIVK